MNAPHDWQRWAAQLDAQPSNRRLVQQSRTPRTLREAGLSGDIDVRIKNAHVHIAIIAAFAVFNVLWRVFG